MLGMNVGIDFGSSSIVIYVEGKGIVFDEPTLIAYNTTFDIPIAIGNTAYGINGRTDEDVVLIHPIEKGIVSHYKMAERYLNFYLQKICGNTILKPNVIMTVPSSATNLEKHTFLDVVMRAGAGRVCLIEESLASAIGAGIESNNLIGRLIINIGGGATDVSVVTMGSLAVSKSIKLGGLAIDEAIQKYLRKERDILIGPQTAERLKICLGGAIQRKEEIAMVAGGKSGLDNMPISFEVSSTELYPCIHETLNMILNGIKSVLEVTPPELVGDISENGITVTGGTSLLYGLKEYLEEELQIDVHLVKQPTYTCISGMEQIIKEPSFLEENGYLFQTIQEING